MEKTRLLIVEDRTLVRAGLRALAETLEGIEVIGEAKDGLDALEKMGQWRPDVVLMDIAMPDLNGLETTARASREFPEIRILILSMHSNEEYVLQALRAGAAGYMLKDASTQELADAVRIVREGGTYLSQAVSRYLADYVRRVDSEADPLERLSPRKKEVLRLIAEGKNTKEIAHELSISVKTVETHRAQLMAQLDIHDIAGLVRFAIRIGLVTMLP
jgi:DNA-binding NarL/FixJ family response regulator